MVSATRQNAGWPAAACAAPGPPPGCMNFPAATNVAELTVVFGSFNEAASCSQDAADTDGACAKAGAEHRATHAKTRAVLIAILLTGDYGMNGEDEMRMTLRLGVLAAAALVAVLGTRHVLAQAQSAAPRTTLEIYYLDTEGGQATLFVSPSGGSMLVDAGYAGGRDADRIVAAMKEQGVTMLDHMVVTHYHGDHVGGVADLAAKVPIRHFYDHGPYTVELQPNRRTGFVSYKAIRDLAHVTVPKVGDTVPLAGVDVQFVTASGSLLKNALAGAPGAGTSNPFCRDAKLKVPDPTPENQETLGLVLRFGEFRLLNLADLTWNQEHQIVCPNNLVGTFDVFHTTRHGDTNSGAPQLIYAIRPRVAIMNNGERKGGAPEYWKTVRATPGLEDFWQIHRSEAGGAEHNSPDSFLANINETDHGHYLHMTVRTNGSFSIRNSRTGFTKEYAARR
jgi:beta-lactamase superfamily II metal-dependent hydrolase